MEDIKKKQSVKNQVVENEYKSSQNFYKSDLILQDFLKRKVSSKGLDYMNPKLSKTGEDAAQKMDALSLDADKNGPQLVKRNFFGEDIDEVKFHPSYQELMKIAIDSDMFKVKWEPNLKNEFKLERHSLGFASGYLYAMSELGQYCPLCMTDGVARLIDLHCTEEDKKRLLPHIYTTELEQFFTGAMFLTEKSGGSDVGRNLVKAEKQEDGTYLLSGEKWFCSNVNAELIFALARTDESKEGTRGLSIFLIEKHLLDGSKNKLPIVRLKDKLGVRSMASAECILDGTVGKLVGDEFNGFKIMTDMINLSRLYNSIAALSGARRALVEAYNFNLFRKSFGKTAIEHTLIKEKLFELGSLNVANFYLTWRAIEALDRADNGDENEKHLGRLLTPMVKKWSAEKAVYITRESMELMGGIGYIEDGVLPKIMRDIMVLPIWEGAGNIMILDMLRASFKSDGLKVMMQEIKTSLGKKSDFNDTVLEHFEELQNEMKSIFKMEQDELELHAKYFFEKLTTLFQLSLILDNWEDSNEVWMKPTAEFLKLSLEKKESPKVRDIESIKGLMAWEL
ncbi:acyl-CoA dehydrogenase family protein [Marivirga salinae]|uniref:Acyl-CoA dehydrogenase family protein n=1 Tax=Marivirga salinarum TaxID=3059078 RepID=A0AA51NCT4_9BACT|nr:acyl-CoA dehydrogenase family protein [Marivirga sp. BDSF4-3]WMN12793.1 acyl-CoA dehydrogenase family protein [Marivirga sp. BDSF4-3]